MLRILRKVLVDAPPRLPKHPSRGLPELHQRHAYVALRLHPGHGSKYVVHVPREPLEQNARPFVESYDESCLRNQWRSWLGLGVVGWWASQISRPAEQKGVVVVVVVVCDGRLVLDV